jgi:hypothetical protein
VTSELNVLALATCSDPLADVCALPQKPQLMHQ